MVEKCFPLLNAYMHNCLVDQKYVLVSHAIKKKKKKVCLNVLETETWSDLLGKYNAF